jgi:hypothetical protein
MTQAILPLVAAYVAVAVLLLSLNLTSRWAWPIKAAAIGVTTGFFGLSYIGAVSLLGWPSRSTLPPRFQLLWSKLVEPDKHSGEDGGIFLWLDALDDNNLPLNRPRAYQLRWDPNLAKQVAGAQEKRQSGQEVAGRTEKIEKADEGDVSNTNKVMGPPPTEGEETAGMDTVPFQNDGQRMQFEDMPAPVLPDKPPL